MDKKFLATFFGFDRRKSEYPAPWYDANPDVLSAARVIHYNDEKSPGYKLPWTIATAINSMRSGDFLTGTPVGTEGTVVVVHYRDVIASYNCISREMTARLQKPGEYPVVFGSQLLSHDEYLWFGGDDVSDDARVAIMGAIILSEVEYARHISATPVLESIFAFDHHSEEEKKSLSDAASLGACGFNFAKAIETVMDPETNLIEYNAAEAAGVISSVVYRVITSMNSFELYETEFPAGDAVYNVTRLQSLPHIELLYTGGAKAFSDFIQYAEPAAPTPDEPPTKKRSKSRSKKSPIEALRMECKLDIHALSEEEETMVPRMGENYVVDKNLAELAKEIKSDWDLRGVVDLAPNYILEGDAGSGKTAGSKFLADVAGIPRTKITMNPLFESSDLIGAFYPVFSDIEDWKISEEDKEVLQKLRKVVEKSTIRGMSGDMPKTADIVYAIRRSFSSDETRDIIRMGYKIPTEEEIRFAPDLAWESLGKTSTPPPTDDIIAECNRVFENKVFRLMSILTEEAETGGVSYRFIMSELMKAFKNGWLVEIQEAASVLRPGVLTQLNSLLEPNGRIELPNGQYIHRHPDTIVVITTNRDYAGNVDLNESLRDRCLSGRRMDNPSPETMAARALAQVPLDYPDAQEIALTAAKTITAVNDAAKLNCIKGSFGMRSLIGWMMDLRRGDFSEEAFLNRVVYKMTTREDDVEALKTAYRSSCDFYTSGHKKRAPKSSM